MKETVIRRYDSAWKMVSVGLLILLLAISAGGGYWLWKTNKLLEEVRVESEIQLQRVTTGVDSILNRYLVLVDSLGIIRDTVIEKHYRYHTKFVDRWNSVTKTSDPDSLLNEIEWILKQ
jgi:hypothetical protein